jgi:hypothetical protein
VGAPQHEAKRSRNMWHRVRRFICCEEKRRRSTLALRRGDRLRQARPFERVQRDDPMPATSAEADPNIFRKMRGTKHALQAQQALSGVHTENAYNTAPAEDEGRARGRGRGG